MVATRNWTVEGRGEGASVSVANWKGGTGAVADFEYDHSLRPPHAKIAHTVSVFTQRHRLADRFVNRSETDERRKGKMDIVLDAMEGPGESSRSPGGRNGGWFGETENVRGCERVKGRWKEAGKRDSGKGKRKYEGRWDRGRTVRVGVSRPSTGTTPPNVAQYALPTFATVHRLDAALSLLNGVLQDLFRIFHLPFQ